MKKVLLVVAVVGLFTVSCKEDKSKKTETSEAKEVINVGGNQEMTHKVSSSEITWKGYKPTESHNGTVGLKSGFLNYADNTLQGGKFTIDMKSIKVLDIENAEYNEKLRAHLSNEDFFDAEKYPTGTFEITKVTPGEITSTIEGNLTLKGITKSITFPASVIEKDETITFMSNALKIDRTEFGIQYKSTKFFDDLKDKFIKDIFDITFNVTAQK